MAPFISIETIHKFVYLYLFLISASAIVLVVEKYLLRFKKRARKVSPLSWTLNGGQANWESREIDKCQD